MNQPSLSSETLTLRSARPSDVEAVRNVLVQTWHHTFDAVLGPDKVAALTTAWHSLPVLSAQLIDRSGTFLVAETSRSTIAGHLFARFRSDRVLYVYRLYVLPEFQRQGIGAALMAHAVDQNPQAERIFLTVLEGNPSARAFYAQQGFTDIGEVNQDGLTSVKLEKPLRGTT